MESDSNKRVAVITGGGRGFGKAFGAALAKQGVIVALVDRDAQVVQLAAHEIGVRAVAFGGDVTDEARAQTKQLFDHAFRAWAKVNKEHHWLVEEETKLEGLIHRYRQDVLNGKPLPEVDPILWTKKGHSLATLCRAS